MAERSLLPPNATPLERAIETAIREAMAFPRDFARIMDPDRCPPELLGHLAWHTSVDEWDDGWSEARKRATIRASAALHRSKGTRPAIEAALAPFEAGWTLSAWHEHGGPPFTFRVQTDAARAIAAPTPPTRAATIAEVRRAVTAAKPVRAHFAIRMRETPGAAGELRTAIRLRARHAARLTPAPRPHRAAAPLEARGAIRLRARWRAHHQTGEAA